MSDAFEKAWQLLASRTSADYKQRSEDPSSPETVQAMQLAIELPKVDPPSRNQVLVDAARATVAVCLDEQAGLDSSWRHHLVQWYDHRIRKVARRGRNKAWRDVQVLPGVTCGVVRAFVPSAVSEVPHSIAKLQIKGTDLARESAALSTVAQLEAVAGQGPVLVVNDGLRMSVGKAAAQVGHASMLLAAALSVDEARCWAQRGFALSVVEVSAELFALCLQRAADATTTVVVRDAGYTEVAPDSATVVAFSSWA